MDYGLDDYDLLDDQPSAFARWVLPALIISILLHIILFFWLANQHLMLLRDDTASKSPPPTMIKLRSVTIPPEVLQPKIAEKKKVAASPQAFKLPKDRPSLGAMKADNHDTPAAPKIDNPMLAEKPKIEATSYQQTVQDAENGGVKSVSKELDQVRNDLLSEKPGVTGKPLLDLAKPDLDSGASPGKQGTLAGGENPGFSNLDDLLAETGPLTAETAPIRMDSDVLYEYNSYALQPQAVVSLQKLGQIIQKNPQLDFSIEGHSDSHGPDDYNMQLSLSRAESVKAWLVQNMGIDPSHIATKGFGKTRLIVPPNDDIEKESANRRVEIVLHDRTPAAPAP